MNHDHQPSVGKSAQNRKWLFRVGDGIFLFLLAAYLFLGMTRVPFFGDESTFIRLSMDFAFLFQDHDIQRVTYRQMSDSESQEPYTD